MKGYKVFNPDWTCKGFKYEVGKKYHCDGEISCCENGFHFCTKLAECFKYYEFNSDNKVAEIEASGDIDSKEDDTKHCASDIEIIREITWHEVLDMINEGKDNTGMCNTGNRNTGDRNTGNRNTGDWNTGNRNTGDCNTGDRNTGDRNTGDWNTTSFSSGCFNTEEAKILMFNKPSDWTFGDWFRSDARYLMNQIKHDVLEWIYLKDMTDEEKKEHPEAETTGGYLKVLDESECGQIWWDGLNPEQKLIIKALPNFDKSIFEEITGIKIDE